MTRIEVIAAAAPRVFARAVEGDDGCLLWTGALSDDGYGAIKVGGAPELVHRVVVAGALGDLPEGMVVDHTCHSRSETCRGGKCDHRRCVNPEHLELVTHAENVRRGSVARRKWCARDHEFTPENTVITSRGDRLCRTCRRISNTIAVRRIRARRALAAANIEAAA